MGLFLRHKEGFRDDFEGVESVLILFGADEQDVTVKAVPDFFYEQKLVKTRDSALVRFLFVT